MKVLARSDRLGGREAPDGVHVACDCGEHFIWERRRGETVTCPSCKAVETIAQPRGRIVKPLILMVGADKGGTGKTTVCRALAEFLEGKGFTYTAFDTEHPQGGLKRFVPEATVVNLETIEGQMRAFDEVRGILLVDVRAGMLSRILRLLNEVRLLEEVKRGEVNLALLHVLGPTRQSLGEVIDVALAIGGSSQHIPVKNFVSSTADYLQWANDPAIAATLEKLSVVTVPHLEDRAAEEIDVAGIDFSVYAGNGKSRTLRGKTLAWLGQVWAEFDRVGIAKLAAEAVA